MTGHQRGWARVGLGEAGFTVLELLITTTLFAILVNIGAPRLFGSDLALSQGHAQLLADLRSTRANAMTSGDHTRLQVTNTHTYTEWRLRLINDAWVPGGPPQSRELPEGVTFSTGVGASFEFDTRGLLTDPDAAAVLELADSRTGFRRNVRVWPSGQVAQ